MDKTKYNNLFRVLFHLAQIWRKDGPQGLEWHIENPDRSCVLKILESHPQVVEAICDTFRVIICSDLSTEYVRRLFEVDGKGSTELAIVAAYFWAVHSGSPPYISCELGRRQIPVAERISFDEMDNLTKLPFEREFTEFDRAKQLREEAKAYAKHLLEIKAKKSWESAVFLEGYGVKRILDRISKDKLLLALKNAHPGARAGFLIGLPTKSVKLLLEDLDHMGPVRPADEKAARQEIFQAILKLEKEREIHLWPYDKVKRHVRYWEKFWKVVDELNQET